MREATLEEIKSIARKQMMQEGTASLSLRAIAAEMGMTAPALYRYYDNRDNLITALVLDAYNSLADFLEAAVAGVPEHAYGERLMKACLAYREWALVQPADYILIFGNPIPGYQAPEITRPAAFRVFGVFVRSVQLAWQQGKISVPEAYQPFPPALYQTLADWIELRQSPLTPEALQLGTASWARLHGMVSLELYNQLRPFLGDATDFYRFEVRALIKLFGLEATE